MPPQQSDRMTSEESPLVGGKSSMGITNQESFGSDTDRFSKKTFVVGVLTGLLGAGLVVAIRHISQEGDEIFKPHKLPTGPYKLVERQEGEKFFDYYDFYDGPDSLGSAGYNTYVSKDRAVKSGIFNVTIEDDEEFVYMSSASTEEGPRESIRLEGKELYNHGLFIIDLPHMPAGCGIWPAFWLTNEESWPDKGEIDIVEGVNFQSVAKTALHTSAMCSMFAHVPDWVKTGDWDWATGLPDTFTGEPKFDISKPADDCWNMAQHQWGNQGCVAISPDEGTLGTPFNDNGGGVFALEWDPEYRRIRSWAFSPHGEVPDNLKAAMDTANAKDPADRVIPDTDTWGLPYAYFAIGETTGCSADHFRDMRLVLNLAFCGNVSGNRYFGDCPAEAKEFKVKNDPIGSCNKFIKSEPEALSEAYWKIRGAYVYQREMEHAPQPQESDEN
mmetsp:Transcript_9924/g.15283  ORF Transcript_9924/g.15283 Transcript_9924/m.15283 type:complete len:443 (+) Transcript_9924:111-1439(+)